MKVPDMKNIWFPMVLFLLLTAGVSACDAEKPGDSGFRSVDPAYMEMLIRELDFAGVEYRLDGKGFVRYPKHENARFKAIQEKVDRVFYPFPEGWSTINSTDSEYMELLKKELKSAGIRFVVGKQGRVEFSRNDKARFEKINNKVRRILYGGIRFKTNSAADREKMIAVLKKEGVEYRVQTRKDGIWVRWYPKDEQQRKEIYKKLGFSCVPQGKVKSADKKASSAAPPVQQADRRDASKNCAS